MHVLSCVPLGWGQGICVHILVNCVPEAWSSSGGCRMSTAEKGMSEVSVLAMVTVIVAGMGTSVVRAPGAVSVTDEIF